MSTETETLDAIYNAGERLVPGETHDRAEIVRHKSSYQLFRDVIESDLREHPALIQSGIKILDIGCGTGHGTYMLDGILGATIVGIDPSVESVQYAIANYGSDAIEYINCDAEAYVSQSNSFDYVVSRHALEHVENGLNFALRIQCGRRLMVNVPFNESEGNIHHLVHRIKEEHFDAYPHKEFFYEGLDGVTELSRVDENPPNSIVCISSAPDLKPVSQLLDFPVPAWKPEFLQNLGIESLEVRIQTAELLSAQKQNQLAEKELQLENHHANLINLEKDVVRRETWIVEKESQLDNHEVNLNGIRLALTEREAVIVEKEQLLSAFEESPAGRAADLERRQAEFAQVQSSVLARETQVVEKEAALKAHEAQLNEIEASLNLRQEQVTALEADVVRREVLIVEKTAQLLTHEVNLNGIQEDLVRRNQAVSSSEQALHRREAAISDKEAQLTARELSVVDNEAHLAQHSNALSSRESAVRDVELAVAADQARLAAQAKELAEMEVDLVRRETLISNSLISKVALKLGSLRK